MRIFYQLTLFALICFNALGQSVDSLLLSLEKKEGADRIEVLHDLLLKVWLNYPDQAMEYGREALEIAEEIQDSTNISKSLRLIAGVYYYRGDFDQSLQHNIKALNIATIIEDSTLINNGYNNIGLLYYNLGSYQIGLEYLLRSVDIKAKLGETYGLPTTLNNIGLIYERIEDYKEARNYFEEAYRTAVEIEDQTEVYALNNIGITHLKERNLDTAEEYFRRGLTLARNYKNINWGSVSLRGIGEIFLLRGQLDSAKDYCLRSLEASLSIDDKKGITEAYNVLTKFAMAQGDTRQALDYLQSSMDMASRLKMRQHMLENLQLFIAIYDERNDLTSLKEYQTQYLNLRDSLFRDVISRNLSLVPIKLKEEADRITLANQQAEIQSTNITNKLYAVILIISIPSLIFLIVLLRKNQKAHSELVAYNEELQRTQKLLVTSEKMASLGVMAAGIAHEVNNPLNFIKNGVEALSSRVYKEDKEKRKEVEPLFQIVDEGVDRASNIVKSLSHFSRKSPKMNDECDVKEIIENCLLILHNRIKDRVQILTEFKPSTVKVKGNEGRLHQAMMNIIANAEQAINRRGTIKISTEKKGKNLEIMVEDDGQGIVEEHLSKISDPFFTTKAPGEGTGLGLFITFSIIEEHNGHIDVMSNPDRGTVFIISLPISGR